MKKALTVFVFFSLLALFVVGSFAQPPQRMMRANRMFDRGPSPILRILKANQEELGISDDQMEQIENLVLSNQEKMINMQNDIDLQRLGLQKLMQDRDNLDYTKIEAVLSKMSADRNEMFIERLKQRDEINKVLTPEQRDALKSLVREGFGRRFRSMRDRGEWFRRFPRMRGPIRR